MGVQRAADLDQTQRDDSPGALLVLAAEVEDAPVLHGSSIAANANSCRSGGDDVVLEDENHAAPRRIASRRISRAETACAWRPRRANPRVTT
ncbi:MAG: hypothetical protein R3F11_07770 [Verrucomicrobiales bacterium]